MQVEASKNGCFLPKRTFREGEAETLKESHSPFHTAAQRSSKAAMIIYEHAQLEWVWL